MVTSARTKLTGNTKRDIETLDALILDALNTLIQRAGDPATPDVSDERPDAADRRGVLMDCEFGLLLLAAQAALARRDHLGGDLADPQKVRTLTVALVKRVLHRICGREQLRGGNPDGVACFFAAEPYATSTVRNMRVFSAHLDAAMLVVGFLGAALPEYDAVLSKEPSPDPLKDPKITSLRDAALLACREGLDYALRCRVEHADGLVSFTCDPVTNQEAAKAVGRRPGGLSDFDRLFFTWTTAETINELVTAKNLNAYLDGLRTGAEPACTLATQIRRHVENLNGMLGPASEWCYQTFGEAFVGFEPPNLRPLVDRFRDIPNAQTELPRDLDQQVSDALPKVQHVYHLSQYAAIRSIAHASVSLEEVGDLCDVLNTMVTQSVLGSTLDGDRHGVLFRILTREYSLGWNADKRQWDVQWYPDDAYFPLVVRALSGLLRRTLTTLSDQENRDTVLTLVAEFRRVLRVLTATLIERRPDRSEHQALWSYLPGGPYVLYATQRTIFAILAYQEFLERMDSYEKDGRPARVVTPDAAQQQLVQQLARIADALVQPALLHFLAALAPPGRAENWSDPGAPGPASDGGLLSVPEWVREPLLAWLRHFQSEFERQKVEQNLRQWADKLVQVRQALERRAITDLSWKPITREVPLDKATPFDQDHILPILFDYVLRKYLRQALEAGDNWLRQPITLVPADESPWSHIGTAIEKASLADAGQRSQARQVKP